MAGFLDVVGCLFGRGRRGVRIAERGLEEFCVEGYEREGDGEGACCV